MNCRNERNAGFTIINHHVITNSACGGRRNSSFGRTNSGCHRDRRPSHIRPQNLVDIGRVRSVHRHSITRAHVGLSGSTTSCFSRLSMVVVLIITASCGGDVGVRHPPHVVFTNENLQRQVDGTAGSTSGGNVQNQGDHPWSGRIAPLCMYGIARGLCPSRGCSERHEPTSTSDLWPADVLPRSNCRDSGRSTKAQRQKEGSGGIWRSKVRRTNGWVVRHHPASQLYGRDSVLVGFVRRRCGLLRRECCRLDILDVWTVEHSIDHAGQHQEIGEEAGGYVWQTEEV
mmetsp:Transcript_8149/g.13506  ORF Transcript_8149/g.13506 Transcript_8149/m.13506 type:complete len:286 (-) Transcript_8149:66-923(-)